MVKQTMVHLDEEQIAKADVEAARRGISRSALIREAVDAYLAESRAASIDQQLRDGYERIPQATFDQWGSLVELADHGTREMLARLAAEESASGNDPW